MKVFYGTHIGNHVAKKEYPHLWELSRELGNLRANLDHWKNFVNGLFGFLFHPLYILLGGNIVWGRTIICLLMILILCWDM